LDEVLTSYAYAHTHALGGRLADGIEATISRVGLPWTTHRFWPRSGYTFAPSMPRSADEAYETLDVPLRRLMRVYLANRGIWEAIIGAGPTCSVPATEGDVDVYVDAFGSLIVELTS
jgi:glutamate-1-semialdehyde 2,1-aminomutase